jgi:haloalkane dehalogenase
MSRDFQQFVARHQGRDLDRNGLRLHFLDEGEGEPLIMLHGNPTWSFLYRHLIEQLNGSCRIVVPDHIGCGLSDKPDDARYAYRLANRVDDLAFLIDQLGLRGRLTLVLHDWGGMIGMTYAARYPERIARLIIGNTAAFHKPAAKSFPWALWVVRDTLLGAWLVRRLNLFARGTCWIGCKKRPLPRAVRNAYTAPYDSWAHRIAIHRFVQDIPLRPGDQSFDLISCTQDRLALLDSIPMLIVWGMKDFVFDATILQEWLRRFPLAEVHRFPKAGHLVFEDERDAIGELVQSFLRAHPLIREAAG